MDKGFFITFEGADGCGKTTQLDLIARYLGEKAIKTREPGATALGKKLREILLHSTEPVADECETFLYLADRAQHVETLIKPAIEQGKIVLCDRFIDSTVAYQGYGRGIDIDRINYLNNIATGGLKPDLTIVFDVDTKVAQTRLGDEKDRLESLGIDFHARIRKGYLEIAKQEPERIVVVDANRPIEEVYKTALNYVKKLLN